MDMCLAEVIGSKATAATRPRMDALAIWFAGRADPGDRLEACVFANVGAGQEAPLARWVANLRSWGWAVFVKPKQRRHDDIDGEMIRHIERRFRQGSLAEVIVASHDAKAFGPVLHHLAARSVHVSVLGFREREFLASASSDVGFIDAEDVPGLFAERLPRTNLYDLPHGGRWFDPFTEIEPSGNGEGARARALHGPDAVESIVPAAELAGAVLGTDADEPDEPEEPDEPDVGGRPEGPIATLPLHDGATVSALNGRSGPTEDATEAAARTDAADAPSAPSRVGVVEVVAAAVASAGTLTLQEVGELLRQAFPGFSLESAGYGSVGELLETLQADAALTLARSVHGHVLVPATPVDAAPAETPAESPIETIEPGDLGAVGGQPPAGAPQPDTTPAEPAEPDEPPTDESGQATMIELPADTVDVPAFDEFRPRDAVVLDLTGHRAEVSADAGSPPGPSGPPPAARQSGEDDRRAGSGGVSASAAPSPAPPGRPAVGPNPIYRLFGFDPRHPR